MASVGDLRMECKCGAGLCLVQPVTLNPRFLFICCPKTQDYYNHGGGVGCGFMQCRDTKDPYNITTWNHSPPPPPPPPLASQDDNGDGVPTSVPPSTPPPAQFMCPCGAGPCSVGFAKNDCSFYSCSACKFRKWCDDGLPNACYLCGKEGHWANDCPRMPLWVAGGAAANNKTICFYCKLEGHFAAQCPRKVRRRRRN